MNTTFIISGGAGRVITAIPALEKYARLNPEDDFRVLVYGWESLFWGNPILQQRTFGIGQKGVFDNYVKNYHVKSPEPYQQWSYYNQKTSLAEAFDEEINNTTDHSDLGKPNLYLQKQETESVKFLFNEIKQKSGKSKFIVFQPYGSGMSIVNGRPLDTSHRSIDCDDYLGMARKLNEDYNIIFFGPPELKHPGDNFSYTFFDKGADLRMYMTMISQADYFFGCDSVGQHMARAFNKPGLIMMGSTFEKNVTYPDHFKIFRNGRTPTYSPIRIGGPDCEFADRMNDGIMNFTEEELQKVYSIIVSDLGKDNLAKKIMSNRHWDWKN